MLTPQVAWPEAAIRAYCDKWKIEELALFGSILRPDFGPTSDIDVLVKFRSEAAPSLFDLVQMEDELAHLLGRPVDLVTRRSIEDSPNYLRRTAILSSAQVVYAAR